MTGTRNVPGQAEGYYLQETRFLAHLLDAKSGAVVCLEYLGDVSTVLGILITAIDLDLLVDADWVSSFDADIIVQAGEVAFFKPSGDVYVQNQDSGETPKYEYYVIGTT